MSGPPHPSDPRESNEQPHHPHSTHFPPAPDPGEHNKVLSSTKESTQIEENKRLEMLIKMKELIKESRDTKTHFYDEQANINELKFIKERKKANVKFVSAMKKMIGVSKILNNFEIESEKMCDQSEDPITNAIGLKYDPSLPSIPCKIEHQKDLIGILKELSMPEKAEQDISVNITFPTKEELEEKYSKLKKISKDFEDIQQRTMDLVKENDGSLQKNI